ncbi:MAG: hypothetical protein ACK5KO_07475 [Arachnia sp.]
MTVRLPPAPSSAPDLDEDFSGELRGDQWVQSYVPHWTTPERAQARFAQTDRGLQLRIEADQLDWRPEDAPLRVSNFQTGNFGGPVGSLRGTHRHRLDGLAVRTELPTSLWWAPAAGRVDVTVSATRDADCMLAVRLVGTGHLDPTDSGEICLFEIDAPAGQVWSARTGIKQHTDSRLTTDMATIPLGFDAGVPHTWTVIWGGDETVIGVDGDVLRRLPQSPSYPLFLLMDLFELGAPTGAYPKTATIHSVRGWSTQAV